jgi:hypothetical protein
MWIEHGFPGYGRRRPGAISSAPDASLSTVEA